MTPEAYAFLTSAAGQHLLEELAAQDLSDGRVLGIMSSLRRSYPPALAAAAMEQAQLRRAARDKFGAEAARLFFTRDALQQASDPRARRWRASQLSGTVIDAGCGIGADSLAYAGAGCSVLGLDLDAGRVLLARHNAEALGLADRARFAVHDITGGLPEACDWAFFDPARRDAQGRRLHHVERYLPPLSTLARWASAARVMAKLSPAVALDDIRAYGGVVSFVSVEGELKEAVLTPDDSPQTTQAVLCDGEQTYVWPWTAVEDAPLRPPAGWLIEPDAALIRAGMVQHAAHTWQAAQIDDTIAYLVADAPPETPWARAWPILDALPFNLKKLRAYLSARGVGAVTVKKRGHAMTPEELTAALRLRGDHACTVVLTRCAGQPYVLICP